MYAVANYIQDMRPATISKMASPNPVVATEVAAETGTGGGALLALGPLAGAGEEEEELGTTSIFTFIPPAQWPGKPQMK